MCASSEMRESVPGGDGADSACVNLHFKLSKLAIMCVKIGQCTCEKVKVDFGVESEKKRHCCWLGILIEENFKIALCSITELTLQSC